MNKLFFAILWIVIFPLILSCSNRNSKNTDSVSDALVSHIDSSVNPGDDFFMFANGRWFKENPIPANEQSNGLWQLIRDTINSQIRNICESSASVNNAPAGSARQKIGDFFFSGMDSVSRNKNGISGLKPDLDRIDRITNLKELIAEAAFIQTVAGSPVFGFYVGQDDRISSKYAVFLYQDGLSLPDRSFYFDQDPRAVSTRLKFVEHLANMFKIMGYDDASAKSAANRQMKLETAIASKSRKLEDTRDPVKNYNKFPLGHLMEMTPNIDWKTFFAKVGLPTVDSVIVGQPEFMTAINGYLKTIPLDDWKFYLKYHLVRGLAGSTDDITYRETFNFYSTVLRGIKEPQPRWKRVVKETDGSLGELIGQIYVDEYLPKGTKEKLQEIGDAIRLVYAERIKSLDWMSSATKEKALTKLNTVIFKVGYPDKWKDMSNLRIDRTSFLMNAMNCNKWWFAYQTSKYGKPVDRTEWNMQPQNYNAYYSPSNNEIVVPGCNIIVPGYERKMADDALLYAIIGGSTFGHEITHGFDDQGSKYDENGNLRNWWAPEDSVRFYSKTKLIVDQFNGYVAVDSLRINGEMTQGENIADLAGVVMGYEAFKKTAQYKNQEIIAGLTPDQRFFLGYALAWMINDRPEAVANQVRSDVHSPARFRVLGPLANMPEFYAAFNVKPGDGLWRPDSLQAKIW